MENLPTAEEFLLQSNVVGMTDLMTPLMIEFAKLHVGEALRAAYDNIEYTEIDSSVPYVVEDSILNSYPLEKIK